MTAAEQKMIQLRIHMHLLPKGSRERRLETWNLLEKKCCPLRVPIQEINTCLAESCICKLLWQHPGM